jgi:hypothetical protein
VQEKRQISPKLLLIVFLFLAPFCNAQKIIPGYIGKRNIAVASGRIYALTLYNYLVDMDNTNATISKRALGWEVGMQRVIGRNGMMGVFGSYLKSDVFSAPTSFYEKSSYSGFDAGIQFRSYYYRNKGSIAPVGKHFRYNILFSTSTLRADYMNTLIGKTADVGIGLGAGNSRVLYDKLWVDYGWEFNYYFNVYDQQDVVEGFSYTNIVRTNLRTMYLVTFKVNFGYLY